MKPYYESREQDRSDRPVCYECGAPCRLVQVGPKPWQGALRFDAEAVIRNLTDDQVLRLATEIAGAFDGTKAGYIANTRTALSRLGKEGA